MLAFQPLLADVGGLIAIAFLIISFIGWVSNLVSKQQQPPQRRERKPQDRKVRDEIEAFLAEAQGKPRPQRPPRDVEILDANEVEVVSEPPRQRRQPSRPQPPPQRHKQPPRRLVPAPQPPASDPPASKARTAPGQDVAGRHVADAHLGQSLTQHVQSHMAERVGQLASRDVEPTVDDTVAAHMGTFSADAGGQRRPASVTPAASELLKLLRHPEGVKQAVILGEILNPPHSLRRGKR